MRSKFFRVPSEDPNRDMMGRRVLIHPEDVGGGKEQPVILGNHRWVFTDPGYYWVGSIRVSHESGHVYRDDAFSGKLSEEEFNRTFFVPDNQSLYPNREGFLLGKADQLRFHLHSLLLGGRKCMEFAEWILDRGIEVSESGIGFIRFSRAAEAELESVEDKIEELYQQLNFIDSQLAGKILFS